MARGKATTPLTNGLLDSMAAHLNKDTTSSTSIIEKAAREAFDEAMRTAGTFEQALAMVYMAGGDTARAMAPKRRRAVTAATTAAQPTDP
jgi:hypothetical protein